jgi:large subunit ribosomal protein L2
MGKSLIQQRRGKGSMSFRSPSHRFKAEVSHAKLSPVEQRGTIIDIIICPGHSSPLAVVQFENGELIHMIAPEGVCVNQTIVSGAREIVVGNCVALKDIPEGTYIYNIESQPGDGGKFVRSTGIAARVVARYGGQISVMLPSKKERLFPPECRANIGIIAGSGRTEKPFVKAGRRWHKMHARNRNYPNVCGTSMNAVDHPYGTSRSSKKGRPTIARRHAPPGAKVGKIRPRRTGRKQR